jgi:hypothetical protein
VTPEGPSSSVELGEDGIFGEPRDGPRRIGEDGETQSTNRALRRHGIAAACPCCDPGSTASHDAVPRIADLKIVSPTLQRVHRNWQNRRNGRILPACSSFDVLDLKYLIGNLNLLDVLHDLLRFHYRVHCGLLAMRPNGLSLRAQRSNLAAMTLDRAAPRGR